MMIGQFDGKVAAKFQVALPKKFRDALGDQLILTKGLDRCMMIVSGHQWQVLMEGTAGKPFLDKKSREVQRFILGNATEVDLDAKGRFVLPEFLRTYAGLSDEVVFIGQDRYVEVWDKEGWENYQQELSGRVETVADSLIHLSEEGDKR